MTNRQPQRPMQRAVVLALVVLALLVVIRFAIRRTHAPPHPSGRFARDAGQVTDAGTNVPDVPPTDAGPAGRNAAPIAPVDPQQLALEDRRRDAVAAQIYRDLLQRGRRVATVRATSVGAGGRDNLRVQGAMCNDAVNRELARTYPLRQVGYTLVTCVHPTTRNTFVTGIPQEDPPGSDARPATDRSSTASDGAVNP